MKQRIELAHVLQSETFRGASFQSSGTDRDFQPISSGTQVPGQTVVVPTSGLPAATGAVAWLHSDAARPYQGRWVALDAKAAVVGDGDSPAELAQAIASDPSVTIFYVIPDGVKLVG